MPGWLQPALCGMTAFFGIIRIELCNKGSANVSVFTTKWALNSAM